MYTLLVLISTIKILILSLELEVGPYITTCFVISIFLSTQATRPQDMEIAVGVMVVVFTDDTMPEGAAGSVCVCVCVLDANTINWT